MGMPKYYAKMCVGHKFRYSRILITILLIITSFSTLTRFSVVGQGPYLAGLSTTSQTLPRGSISEH